MTDLELASQLAPQFDVVDTHMDHVSRHRVVAACLVVRHGWKFSSTSVDIVEKAFDGIRPDGEPGILTVSAHGSNIIQATWGWEDHGLVLVPVNVAPSTIARDADAAVERFAASLRAQHVVDAAPEQEEAEGLRP